MPNLTPPNSPFFSDMIFQCLALHHFHEHTRAANTVVRTQIVAEHPRNGDLRFRGDELHCRNLAFHDFCLSCIITKSTNALMIEDRTLRESDSCQPYHSVCEPCFQNNMLSAGVQNVPLQHTSDSFSQLCCLGFHELVCPAREKPLCKMPSSPHFWQRCEWLPYAQLRHAL